MTTHPPVLLRRWVPLLILPLAVSLAACVEAPDRTTLAPVEAPTTTAAESAAAEGLGRGQRVESPATVSWTGTSLEDRRVTITPADAPPGVTFVGDRPAVVVEIARLGRDGDCDGLAEQLSFWRFQASTDPPHADVASAFARSALDVAQFIGCPVSAD